MTTSSDVVRVALGDRSYEIEIGTGNRGSLPQFMRARCHNEHAIIVTDDNVDPLYADALGDTLANDGWDVNILIVPAGEPSKSIDSVDELCNAMLEQGADRQSVVLAIGGGVVGDLAGFVAAIFARGLDFYQIPTTLLAQVDSSVGGKTGVNLPGAKNMVGAFWQLRGVLIDVDVLTTLSDREYRAGLAEVVKYGVILDASLFAYLEAQADPLNARAPQVLTEVVRRCCRLKADVVEADERETSGLRAVLNYGHTFAHAFEAASGYGAMLHGEAVAAGMRCAARLAARLGRIDQALVARQDALLERLSLNLVPPKIDSETLIRLMQRDKKVADGRLRFVLPDSLGHVELVNDVRQADIAAALEIEP